MCIRDSCSTVQSTSMIFTDDDPSYSAPSLSKSGFIDLQCPHQGARNLTSEFLPLLMTMSSKFLAVPSWAAKAQAMPARTMNTRMLLSMAPVLCVDTVSYTHLRAHETVLDLVCRLLLEKKKKKKNKR
eukprot:TRINITY_DN3409_c0_g1_i1.p1 TRINITY_DN3409_c0_g1~~TRINITY_DN3409_c0_g1_i1.p1  ORF type:complete len:128 (+),score=46.57 TRINITY_DN3409_c0_g1_i1:171-554(+)